MSVGEGGIRAPMLIDGPVVTGEQRVDGFAYVWDIMPTILDFAGITHPENYEGRHVEPMRGKSLKGVLTGAKKSVYDEKEIVCGEMGGTGMWVRQGDLKTVSVAPPYGDETWRLYNLADDPGETHDL